VKSGKILDGFASILRSSLKRLEITQKVSASLRLLAILSDHDGPSPII
jgi:hypothetical protein